MEQLTSTTGRRHILSTPRSRSRARNRAASLGKFERNAQAVANHVAARISTSKATPWMLATALMLAGSIQPR